MDRSRIRLFPTGDLSGALAADTVDAWGGKRYSLGGVPSGELLLYSRPRRA
jgi:hypothetical protein